VEFKLSNRGNTLIASLAGELDHHTCEQIRQKIDARLLGSSSKNLILDMSKIIFMDSSGIGVIMGRYKVLQNIGGKAALVCPQGAIRRILEMSGVSKYVPVFDEIDSAIKYIAG